MTEDAKVPHLHLAEAQKWIAEIIEEHGADYVYRDGPCRYFQPLTMQPSCIVGHLLVRLGIAPEMLPGGVLPAWNRAKVGALHFGNLLRMDVDVERYLHQLQNYQDHGIPWGQANKRATRLVTGLPTDQGTP